MPPRAEDAKVKAFVEALTLALLNIVSKPSGPVIPQRQVAKSKKNRQARKRAAKQTS